MTTGLDQAIIEWWRATAVLSALVPVDRVASEIMQVDETKAEDENEDDRFDACVIFQIASEPHWRTNSAQNWKSTVKMSAMSFDYDQSKTIAQQIATAWNSSNFTGSGSTITVCRFNGLTPAQDTETGIWDHTVSFEMHHTGI